MADYYPGLLLLHAREKRGTSVLDADELRGLAAEHWPTRPAEWVDQVVERAIEERDRGVRRIDPATSELRHPKEREAKMATLTTGRLRSWLREQLEADPATDNDTLEDRANREFGADNVSRRSLGQNAGVVRRELEDKGDDGPGCSYPRCTREEGHSGDHDCVPGAVEVEASTNGRQPPTPSAGAAEPDPPPATDPVEGVGASKELGGVPARRHTATPEQTVQEARPVTQIVDRMEYSERRTLERRTGVPPNRVSVDVDPETGVAHLFVDVRGLTAGAAYRIAAQAQLALAEAGEAS